MKKSKLPYIHIVPRVLLGTLGLGLLVGLIGVAIMGGNPMSMAAVADAATPLPTMGFLPEATATAEAVTPAPTFAPTAAIGTPATDVVVLSAYSTLRLGDDNASVSALQQRLTDLGYLDSDIPGSLYNESIAGAVTLFQRSCDMQQTGVADSATQESLYNSNAQSYRIKRGDTGTDVVRLQQRLLELGFYTDRVNGFFGPNTEQAVMAFQLLNNLPITGVLTTEDWSVLYSQEAVSAPVLPTDTPSPRPTPKTTARATTKATAKSTAKATTKATSKATAKKTATPKPTKTPTPAPTATP